MNTAEKAKKINKYIYNVYGSGTDGVLFGIPASCRPAVETIIRLTIEKVKEEKKSNK